MPISVEITHGHLSYAHNYLDGRLKLSENFPFKTWQTKYKRIEKNKSADFAMLQCEFNMIRNQ